VSLSAPPRRDEEANRLRRTRLLWPRAWDASQWAWLVPLAVAGFVVVASPSGLEQAVAALLGLAVVVFTVRRPDLGLLALIALLPFHAILLAWVFAAGVPGSIVRPLGAWKEAVAIGVLVAGIRGFRAAHRHLDRLDIAGLAYVAVVAIYGLFPSIASLPTPTAAAFSAQGLRAILEEVFTASVPTFTSERFLAFRASAFLVLLLFAARHAKLPANFLPRALRVAMAVGGVVAAIAVFEFFFSDAWNDFVVNKVQYTNYQRAILDVIPFDFYDIRFYGVIGGQKIVRVGSVFFSPLTLGFYLLVPFAAAADRIARQGLRGAAAGCFLLTGAALLFSQTRSALIGALVVAVIVLVPTRAHLVQRRLQFAFVLVAVLLVALPVAAATGLSERATTPKSGDERSGVDHLTGLSNGVDAIAHDPVGGGLATSAGTGQRFDKSNTVISENYYLQVGIETGVVGIFTFVALTVVLLRRLKRAVPDTLAEGGGAIRAMGLALAVGSLFLHTWNDFAVAWTFWPLAGAVLGLAVARAREREAPSLPAQPS
jgi:O-Antigen ligase